jgi:hypothetical protein
VTVTDWIDKYDQEEFVDVDATEIEAMKKTNTLWELQIHPTTPVGYNVAYGSTLDHVIDAAIRDLEDIDVVGCQHVAT